MILIKSCLITDGKFKGHSYQVLIGILTSISFVYFPMKNGLHNILAFIMSQKVLLVLLIFAVGALASKVIPKDVSNVIKHLIDKILSFSFYRESRCHAWGF